MIDITFQVLLSSFLFRKEIFHEYLFSDINQNYLNALNYRINKFVNDDRLKNIKIKRTDCITRINEIFNGKKPENWKDCAYLLFLDSYRFDITWDTMEKILKKWSNRYYFYFYDMGIN